MRPAPGSEEELAAIDAGYDIREMRDPDAPNHMGGYEDRVYRDGLRGLPWAERGRERPAAPGAGQ